jgi:hypothetical protein
MFPLFTCTHFGCGEFYEGGPRVRRPRMKWSAMDESLRNTHLKYHIKNCSFQPLSLARHT